MKKSLLALFFAICFIPAFSQTQYTGSLTNTDLTFNRPDEGIPPTALSPVGTNVYYKVVPIIVPAAGLITISCNSIWDNFAILYNSVGFNPALPLNNSLCANDDFGGLPNSGFIYNFPAAGTYYVVICSYKNNVTGPYAVSTSAALVLPLRLLSFTVVNASSNSNIIKWSSSEESNLNTYQVQHSMDDNHFTDLINGSFAARNTSANAVYSFADDNVVKGYNYYRLKITERSGHISYSPVVLIRNYKAGITSLKIFPNPASDYLKIEVKSMQNKKALIVIIGAGGEIMLRGQYYFNNQSVLSVDIRNLPAGKYFLKTNIENEEIAMVFIKL
ncbi:MAG: T9SS type A sorting domain-containing protein [Rhizobacter sp.]|nr:T9SS type A sorting domain-containing protein [Ferruginibacter sp.]